MLAHLFTLLLDISGTIVTVQPTEHPGASMEVVIENNLNNSDVDIGQYMLEGEGLTIPLQFNWEVNMFGADEIVITPPDGYICEPISCNAVVMEGFKGVIYLIEWMGS